MKILHKIASVLVWVGALNWGLVGIGSFFSGDWNVVHAILGGSLTLENLVYVFVGASAVYAAATHKSSCKDCQVDAPEQSPTM
ncbi:MAG: DUF378 domain-containing protein [Candidatus Paceibacterota bacterium]|jgi:uncharacterized membrane protein YuzA (DUF378 family)